MIPFVSFPSYEFPVLALSLLFFLKIRVRQSQLLRIQFHSTCSLPCLSLFFIFSPLLCHLPMELNGSQFKRQWCRIINAHRELPIKFWYLYG
uniref:Uncharacterized protein n=1 Tax=Rhizophora mucronata TaxID=61149 RepID=A0A2P2P6R0_RHIMU